MDNPWKKHSNISPQVENGYRRIETGIFRALVKQKLKGIEWDILMVTIDKIYGYQKTEDRISYGMLASLTGHDRRAIIRAVKILEERRILVVTHRPPINKILFNKHHDTWVVTKRPLVTKQPLGGDKTTTKSGDKTTTHNRYKDNIQKKVDGLFEIFWKEYPKKEAKKKVKQIWDKMSPSEELFGKIMGALRVQKNTTKWLKKKGEYVPMPTTWLNQERWNDEINGSQISLVEQAKAREGGLG